MPTILFICMANQFRSPLAAALCRDLLNKNSLTKDWKVTSAGTWVERTCPAHPKAIRLAEKAGLDISGHLSHEVKFDDLSVASVIIVMTHGQKEALQFEFPQYRNKILMLSELADGFEIDMPDPAESNFSDSEQVFSELAREVKLAVPSVIERITKEELNRPTTVG